MTGWEGDGHLRPSEEGRAQHQASTATLLYTSAVHICQGGDRPGYMPVQPALGKPAIHTYRHPLYREPGYLAMRTASWCCSAFQGADPRLFFFLYPSQTRLTQLYLASQFLSRTETPSMLGRWNKATLTTPLVVPTWRS